MTPNEYSHEVKTAIALLDDLTALHGDACECKACEGTILYLEQLADNPPCYVCDGQGCGQCQYTGTR
jgi:hypothetical protein